MAINSATRIVGDTAPQHNGWEVDKRIPIAVIMSLLAYGTGMVWYVADQASHIATAERRIVALEENAKEVRTVSGNIADKLSSINEKMARSEERSLFILDRLQIPVPGGGMAALPPRSGIPSR